MVAALEVQGQAAAAAAGHQRPPDSAGGGTRSGSPDLRSGSLTDPLTGSHSSLAVGEDGTEAMAVTAEASGVGPHDDNGDQEDSVEGGTRRRRSSLEEAYEAVTSSSPSAAFAQLAASEDGPPDELSLDRGARVGRGVTSTTSPRESGGVPLTSTTGVDVVGEAGQPHDRRPFPSACAVGAGDAVGEGTTRSTRSSGGAVGPFSDVHRGGEAGRHDSPLPPPPAGSSRPRSAKLPSRPNSALVPTLSVARKEGDMPSTAVVLVEGDLFHS